MKISTKGRYAVRILLDIALNESAGNVSVHQISMRQGISEKYIEGIISKLNHAKLVSSVRGKYGGYRLVKSPSEYTLYEILLATEDSLAIVACLEDGASCHREDICNTVRFWQSLQEHIESYLKTHTLGDLITEPNEEDSVIPSFR